MNIEKHNVVKDMAKLSIYGMPKLFSSYELLQVYTIYNENFGLNFRTHYGKEKTFLTHTFRNKKLFYIFVISKKYI